MQHKWFRTLAPVCGLLISLVFAAAAVAAPGNGKSSKVKLEAELAPCCGDPEPEAEGESDYSKQILKGLIKQERFEAKVKIPVPSAGLGIADETGAANADIRIRLSDGIGTYAVCYLDFVELEQETEEEDGVFVTETEAVYKVDVRRQLLKNGTYRLHEVHGMCDIDTLNAGVQNGVPAVESGDMATATKATANPVPPPDELEQDFLSGLFELD